MEEMGKGMRDRMKERKREEFEGGGQENMIEGSRRSEWDSSVGSEFQVWSPHLPVHCL
jgi:hypothetical protein